MLSSCKPRHAAKQRSTTPAGDCCWSAVGVRRLQCNMEPLQQVPVMVPEVHEAGISEAGDCVQMTCSFPVQVGRGSWLPQRAHTGRLSA